MSKKVTHQYLLEGVTNKKVKVRATITTSDIFQHLKRYYNMEEYTDLLIEIKHVNGATSAIYAVSDSKAVLNPGFKDKVYQADIKDLEPPPVKFINRYDSPAPAIAGLALGDLAS
jgi:pyruvate carboxylase